MEKQDLEKQLRHFERKQYFVSLVILITLCALSVLLNRMHLKSVAQENTQFLSKMIKLGHFKKANSILQETKTLHFKKIHYFSNRKNRSFVLSGNTEQPIDQSLWQSLSTDSFIIPVINEQTKTHTDIVTYEFERFRQTPDALILWLLINITAIPYLRLRRKQLIDDFNKDLEEEENKKKLQTELSTWMNECREKDLVCKQIHHDLASPLGLLKISTQKLGDQNLAKPFALSLDRIIRISENLKTQKYIWASENPKLETVASALDTIIQEKRMLTSRAKIKYKLKATASALNKIPDIPVGQFHRVLSNILNNSIDAVKSKGTIKVLARNNSAKNSIELIVSDSGYGVPQEYQEMIFEKQKTFNKPRGSGLGLYHAKLCIESFGGKLVLLKTKKERKHGAAFMIRLPYRNEGEAMVKFGMAN